MAAKSNISIDALNMHLFEAIEMLKNSNNKEASEHEKMTVEQAQAVADIGKVVIEGFKVKANVLKMMRPEENPQSTRAVLESSGIIEIDQTVKMLD